MTSRLVRVALLIGSLLAVQSCSSDATAVTPAPLALAVNPGSLAVQPGGSGNIVATLTETGYTGDVAVTVDGAPAGVTATIEYVPGPSVITSYTRFRIAADSTVPLGSYALTVRAQGGDVPDATAPLTLTVAPVPAPSDISSLVANPNALSLTRGGPGASSTITPTFLAGYRGSFAITTTGLPTGLGSSLTVNGSGTAATFTITFAAGGGVAAGTYPILVTATADDEVPKYAYVVITVQ